MKNISWKQSVNIVIKCINFNLLSFLLVKNRVNKFAIIVNYAKIESKQIASLKKIQVLTKSMYGITTAVINGHCPSLANKTSRKTSHARWSTHIKLLNLLKYNCNINCWFLFSGFIKLRCRSAGSTAPKRDHLRLTKV